MVIKEDIKLKKLNKIFTKKHKIYYKCIDKNCKTIDDKVESLREDYRKNLEINCPDKKKSSDIKCNSKFFKKSEFGKMMKKLDKCHDICSKEGKEMNKAHNDIYEYSTKINTKNNTKKNNKNNKNKTNKK